MTNLNDIRTEFLDFFEKNNHTVLPSSPVIPQNDPTLMFVNAGMVPFKDYFIGNQKPETKRAASSQKCVRAGGKHNDLDNVGHTARHLTFFEMLGNFSFGDYFKEEAISLAWQLLINQFDIPKDRLLITVFHEDEEALKIWKKVSGFSDEKIIRISTNDNFWSMGSEGPCGPCSEIFYDHGDSVDGGPPGSKDEDGDRFVEIWNLVFMQYLKKENQEQTLLPKPSIDTGMGLERISAVLQGKTSSFEIDIFKSLIGNIEELIKVKSNDENIASFRIIADHLRSISFLIADGVIPSNEGRGYVLRRIMRRAMRHSHKLGFNKPVLFDLSKLIINLMDNPYNELKRAEKLINITLHNEEDKFLSTLSRGLKILEEESSQLGPGDIFDGKTAFKLYDTYGFPIDLTKTLLAVNKLSINQKQFDSLMAAQREGSKNTSMFSAKDIVIDPNLKSEFMGYEESSCEATCLELFDEQGNNLTELIGKGFALFSKTPFYAEMGGQVGDTGSVIKQDSEILITDCKKVGNYHLHQVLVSSGSLCKGDTTKLLIDLGRREKINCNHSATHLLHSALRAVLGDKVFQKGSLVNDDNS